MNLYVTYVVGRHEKHENIVKCDALPSWLQITTGEGRIILIPAAEIHSAILAGDDE